MTGDPKHGVKKYALKPMSVKWIGNPLVIRYKLPAEHKKPPQPGAFA